MKRLGISVLLLGLGCAESRSADPFATSSAGSSATATATDGVTSASASGMTDGVSGGETGTDSADADDAADSADTEDPIFDVGGAADDGILPGDGCTKIDFLFVVDNSGSMGAHQAALASSFGPFMDTIFATVEAQDYHIMVVDSDADGDIAGACEPCSPDSFWCGDYCDAKPNLDMACETAMGAGEVAPYNNEASNTICGVPDGKRYLTSDLGAGEIKDLFQCMAKVGVFGSGAEMPISALAEAVTTQNAPGACNDGFVRDDAILVATFITDDYPVPGTADNASTVGSPQQWYDAVVSAKNGNADNVVMLGIMNTEDATCVRGAGDPIVHPTPRFLEFVDLFGDRGLTGNICSADYNDFFQQAVDLIDTACDEYVPEG